MLVAGSERPSGLKTGTESYDAVFRKYENAKGLLHQIKDTFFESFNNVKTVMGRYQSTANSELINELSMVLDNTKTSLQELFTSIGDPGLFQPTQLEQQIKAYKMEKEQGYEMLRKLQSEIEGLKQEKQNWQLREQKGIKTMEEYKRQLAEYKNGTYIQHINDKKPLNGTIDNETNVCFIYTYIYLVVAIYLLIKHLMDCRFVMMLLL